MAVPPASRSGATADVAFAAGLTGLLVETWRLRLMRGLEDQLAALGYPLVAGVDEAGRGCLAGPVVAAAVVVDPGCLIPGVDDSKRLGPAHRERLAGAIKQHAVAWAIGVGDAALIDRINVLEATRWAMRQALQSLAERPDVALVDAVALDGAGESGELAPTLPVIRGDALSFAVACASIVAKADRDRMMTAWDREYPGFGFASHKGYASARHRRALRELGPTPLHRLTFRSVLPERE